MLLRSTCGGGLRSPGDQIPTEDMRLAGRMLRLGLGLQVVHAHAIPERSVRDGELCPG